jgi:poly-gamma-glutamate capsule biosynthesis protein CapA/YwtB (metallophosphatase superfamily)
VRGARGGWPPELPAARLGAAAPALLAALALSAAGPARALKPAAGAPPRTITLEWVGDIALSAQRGLPPGGLYRALAPVRRELKDADVTAGNLEGTLSTGGASKCGGIGGGSCFAFQAPPGIAGQVRALGFDLVNQANNHSLDYGPGGRRQTLAALGRAGLASTGLPGEITVLHVAGRSVGFVGFAPYPYDADLLDISAARALVRRARERAQIVVVIIHAGAEGADRLHTPRGTEYYLGEDRGDARAFAHAMIDAGASVVLGSGPHVIRGVERYRGRLIAYSLGNFVGYHTLGGGGVLSESAILRVTLGAGGRLVGARWLPVVLVDGLPRPDPSDASTKLVAALSRADFPADHFAIGPSGRFHLPPFSQQPSARPSGRVSAPHVPPLAKTAPLPFLAPRRRLVSLSRRRRPAPPWRRRPRALGSRTYPRRAARAPPARRRRVRGTPARRRPIREPRPARRARRPSGRPAGRAR